MTHIDANLRRSRPRARLSLRWVLAFVAGLAFAVAYYGLLLAAMIWAAHAAVELVL